MNNEEKLLAEGYVHLDEYVFRHILEKLNKDNALRNAQDWISEIDYYLSVSSKFHEVGGTGYRIIQKCLKHFRDYKFINVKNEFRFQVDAKVSDSGRLVYLGSEESKGKFKKNQLIGTKADIYYLLNEAEQSDYAARRFKEYVNSNKLHLTAILIHLIEDNVDRLLKENSKRYKGYGRILYEAYINPDNIDLDIGSLYDILGLSKKTYYKLRSEAITLMSQLIFGVLPMEKGIAELYIKDGKIVSLYQDI